MAEKEGEETISLSFSRSFYQKTASIVTDATAAP
jgi:hypothetical protein